MADRSDEPKDVAALARLVRDGADVVAGSRYVRGGRQEGGPLLKRMLSRLAGAVAALPGRPADPRRHQQLPRLQPAGRSRQIPIEGTGQLRPGAGTDAEGPLARLARGRGARPPGATARPGQSRFRLLAWLPHYLRWYLLRCGSPGSVAASEAAMRTGDRVGDRSPLSSGPRETVKLSWLVPAPNPDPAVAGSPAAPRQGAADHRPSRSTPYGGTVPARARSWNGSRPAGRGWRSACRRGD